MSARTIAIATDHAGFELKEMLKQDIENMGLKVADLGTNGTPSVDYPDFAGEMAKWIQHNPEQVGVLICGSGIGMSMAANRHRHVRAALCHNAAAASLARRHNNANVLCLGARMIGAEVAKFCLKHFLETDFEGGRHQKRIDKFS